MSVELHLPDLPEVPISIGPDPRAAPPPPLLWPLRLREALAAYLPLVVLGLLALAAWWLVKNAPQPTVDDGAKAVSAEPDYTMTSFALERFDAAGRLQLRIEGERLRHFPATDRIEIDGARIRAIAVDGRVTEARAERALGTGDGSELQLIGGAEVAGTDAAGAELAMRSDFLHAFTLLERVQTHRPVQVERAGSRVEAAGLRYDHPRLVLELDGPLRAVLLPAARSAQRGDAGGARP